MIIIIEGPDGAGKTTLAELIKQRVLDPEMLSGVEHVEVHHKGPPTTDGYTEYVEPLKPQVGLGRKTLHIWDRYHIGEMVYGPMYRNSTVLDARLLTRVNTMLWNDGAVIVHLTNEPRVLRERIAARRGDDLFDPSGLDDVVLAYFAALDVLPPPAPKFIHIIGDATAWTADMIMMMAITENMEARKR